MEKKKIIKKTQLLKKLLPDYAPHCHLLIPTLICFEVLRVYSGALKRKIIRVRLQKLISLFLLCDNLLSEHMTITM